jgi:hypothetical protein
MKEFMCEERGCTHKVVIYKEGDKYRVEPGRLVVHPGAKVVVISLVRSKAGVRVWFPEGVEKGEPQSVPYGEPRVIVAGKTYGAFPYSVFVPDDSGAHFAEGGSAPRIIVADP